MLKEIKSNVELLGNPTVNGESITHFKQLISYIDSALASAYTKEGDEKVQALLTHILNIRDYLTKVIGSNGLRQVLMSEVLNMINQIEESSTGQKQPEEHETKKNEDYLTETS